LYNTRPIHSVNSNLPYIHESGQGGPVMIRTQTPESPGRSGRPPVHGGGWIVEDVSLLLSLPSLHWTRPTLHCTALHCTALHCTALHCTAHAIYSNLIIKTSICSQGFSNNTHISVVSAKHNMIPISIFWTQCHKYKFTNTRIYVCCLAWDGRSRARPSPVPINAFLPSPCFVLHHPGHLNNSICPTLGRANPTSLLGVCCLSCPSIALCTLISMV
jgi:hypothetical protein